MKRKTNELLGTQLDWAVATCEGYTDLHKIDGRWPHEPQLAMMPPRRAYGEVELWQLGYATDWSLSGPIIEREKIELTHGSCGGKFYREATRYEPPAMCEERGPTPLIAAMRCFVSSKLGDEIEIPEELK